MKWSEIDERLRRLYHLTSLIYSPETPYHKVLMAKEETFKIMENLTRELKKDK